MSPLSSPTRQDPVTPTRPRARRPAALWVASGLVVALLAGLGLYLVRQDAGSQGAALPPGTVELEGVLVDMALGEGALWIADNRSAILEVDPDTLRLRRRIDLDDRGVWAIAAGHGAVWVGTDRSLLRIDPETEEMTRTDVQHAMTLSVGPDLVWAHDGAGGIFAIDPATGSMELQEALGFDGEAEAHDLAADPLGGAWLAEGIYGEDGGVTHILPDGSTSRVVLGTGPTPHGEGPYASAAWEGDGSIWVCCDGSGRLAQIDPANERIVGHVPLPGASDGFAEPIMTYGGGLLYSDSLEGVHRIDPATGNTALVLEMDVEEHVEAIAATDDAAWILWGPVPSDPIVKRLTRIPPPATTSR